jgi:hypothetical protein
MMKKLLVLLVVILAVVAGASTIEATSVAHAGNIHSQPVDEGGSTTNYCGYNEVQNGKIIYANFYGSVPEFFGPGHYQCVWDDGKSAAYATCEGCSDYTHVIYTSYQGGPSPYYGPAWVKIG